MTKRTKIDRDRLQVIYAAWPFLSGIPGLHNLIPTVRADCYARWLRQNGEKTELVAGFDEMGSRTQLACERLKIEPQEFLNRLFPAAVACLEEFGISYDRLGRSSSREHHSFVREYIKNLIDAGMIVRETREIVICESCRLQSSEKFIVGSCPNCGNQISGGECKRCQSIISVEKLIDPFCVRCDGSVSNKNDAVWVFRLSKICGEIRSIFKDDYEYSTRVEKNFEEAIDSIDDIVISRRLDWGVSFDDGDSDEKIYNWVDSLLGDLSVFSGGSISSLEQAWSSQNTKHVFFCGIDNLPFFSVLFPSLLYAHGFTLNRKFSIKENLLMTYNGEVCSRSNGKGIRANDALAILPGDYWRIHILTVLSKNASDDTVDFSWEDFSETVALKLVRGFQGWFHQILNSDQVGRYIDEKPIEEVGKWQSLLVDYHSFFETCNFPEAWSVISKLFDMTKESARIGIVFSGEIRIILALCYPFIPHSVEKVTKILKLVPEDFITCIDFEKLLLSTIAMKKYHFSSTPVIFKAFTASSIELRYIESLAHPELLEIRGLGEMCPCEGWSILK